MFYATNLGERQATICRIIKERYKSNEFWVIHIIFTVASDVTFLLGEHLPALGDKNLWKGIWKQAHKCVIKKAVWFWQGMWSQLGLYLYIQIAWDKLIRFYKFSVQKQIIRKEGYRKPLYYVCTSICENWEIHTYIYICISISNLKICISVRNI